MKMRTVFMLICVLLGIGARSVLAENLKKSSSRRENQERWMWFSLSEDSFFRKQTHPASLAQDLFVATVPSGRQIPPIQHMIRPAHDDIETDSRAIAREVFVSLGLDPKYLEQFRRPEKVRGRRVAEPKALLNEFKAGPAGESVLVFGPLLTAADNTTYVTCMAFVRSGEGLHTIWSHGYLTSIPGCERNLLRLAQSPELYLNYQAPTETQAPAGTPPPTVPGGVPREPEKR